MPPHLPWAARSSCRRRREFKVCSSARLVDSPHPPGPRHPLECTLEHGEESPNLQLMSQLPESAAAPRTFHPGPPGHDAPADFREREMGKLRAEQGEGAARVPCPHGATGPRVRAERRSGLRGRGERGSAQPWSRGGSRKMPNVLLHGAVSSPGHLPTSGPVCLSPGGKVRDAVKSTTHRAVCPPVESCPPNI